MKIDENTTWAKDVTYDNIKSKKTLAFPPLFRRYIFSKNHRGGQIDSTARAP